MKQLKSLLQFFLKHKVAIALILIIGSITLQVYFIGRELIGHQGDATADRQIQLLREIKDFVRDERNRDKETIEELRKVREDIASVDTVLHRMQTDVEKQKPILKAEHDKNSVIPSYNSSELYREYTNYR